MRWLHRFLHSDDPIVALVGGLTEPEAELLRDILADDGIVSMVKNMSGLAYQWGAGTLPLSNNFDLFVKQSDLERARETLGLDATGGQRTEAEGR